MLRLMLHHEVETLLAALLCSTAGMRRKAPLLSLASEFASLGSLVA
jgi:hypothetical protein